MPVEKEIKPNPGGQARALYSNNACSCAIKHANLSIEGKTPQ